MRNVLLFALLALAPLYVCGAEEDKNEASVIANEEELAAKLDGNFGVMKPPAEFS